MATGIVKFFNDQRGFGFIAPDDGGPDCFVHITAIEKSGLKDLHEGDKVSFDKEPGRSGKMQATNIGML